MEKKIPQQLRLGLKPGTYQSQVRCCNHEPSLLPKGSPCWSGVSWWAAASGGPSACPTASLCSTVPQWDLCLDAWSHCITNKETTISCALLPMGVTDACKPHKHLYYVTDAHFKTPTTLSLSLSLSHTHTHTQTHACTHTHTQCAHLLKNTIWHQSMNQLTILMKVHMTVQSIIMLKANYTLLHFINEPVQLWQL